MKAHVVEEPELEFRTGTFHVDPRVGLAENGPADLDTSTRPERIVTGLVGTSEQIAAARAWLKKCRDRIERKHPKPGQENLYIDFPGFNPEVAFHSELVFDDALTRELPQRDVRELTGMNLTQAVTRAVGLCADRVRSLAETGKCDVVLCCRPDELADESESDDVGGADEDPIATAGGEVPDAEVEEAGPAKDGSVLLPRDFHDLLKARTLSLEPPLQVIRRETWEGKVPKGAARRLQDPASVAWNLHVALYYKGGGTPWRLPRQSTDLDTCFVGVSFYRTTDRQELHTAVAQVFNERGEGVVVRGGTASVSKADRQPHLAAPDAQQLLDAALTVYREVHLNLPARVVIHKTSSFSDAETDGFRKAADKREVARLELIWVQSGAPRFFRTGMLPPLRGTTIELEPGAMIVYTRGSVDFFRTYPECTFRDPCYFGLPPLASTSTPLHSRFLGSPR